MDIDQDSLVDALQKADFNRTMANDEAAEYIGCTPGTLRVWVSKRKVPFVKVNRLTRFRRKDLDKWLDKQAVPAGAV